MHRTNFKVAKKVGPRKPLESNGFPWPCSGESKSGPIVVRVIRAPLGNLLTNLHHRARAKVGPSWWVGLKYDEHEKKCILMLQINYDERFLVSWRM
jgi:hemolysin-activating ACP:hemolysin acyltransferase